MIGFLPVPTTWPSLSPGSPSSPCTSASTTQGAPVVVEIDADSDQIDLVSEQLHVVDNISINSISSLPNLNWNDHDEIVLVDG